MISLVLVISRNAPGSCFLMKLRSCTAWLRRSAVKTMYLRWWVNAPVAWLMVALPAVGSAILFNLDASTGGTDIVAMLLRKFTSLDIGKALICSDMVITLMACVAFGMETGLYSILGLVIKSLLVDMVLENIHTHKCFHIITGHPAPIEEYIKNNLKRGATKLHGEGIYTHEGREVLLTVVGRREAVLLRRYIKSVDPEACMLITNTSEIIGKGFRGVN